MSSNYEVLRFGSVTSTNDIAKKSDMQQGVFCADEQTAGKGSKGRSWQSGKNEGLYMSFLLRPSLKPEDVPGLTIMAAIVVCRAIEAITGDETKIKWPNDVLIDGRKVCGILTESVFASGGIERVVCGIGINTNQRFTGELKSTAVSLDIDENKKSQLSDVIIKTFFSSYELYQSSRLCSFIEEFRKRSAVSGSVNLITPQEKIKGALIDFDDTGAIIIEVNGQKKRFVAGEISLRGENGYV